MIDRRFVFHISGELEVAAPTVIRGAQAQYASAAFLSLKARRRAGLPFGSLVQADGFRA